MPHPVIEKAMMKFIGVHDTVYQRTNGWIGHRLPAPGVPNNLLLHTTGAKTGQPRTNTLSYARDGATYLVVASNGGANRFPAWYHNVKAQNGKAHPAIEINVGPKRFAVTARIVLPDDPDYARLFRVADQNNSGRYSEYQKKTTRPIAVVVLTP